MAIAKYDEIPEVNFLTEKKLDKTVRNLLSIQKNLMFETFEFLGADEWDEDTDEIDKENIFDADYIAYDNFLVTTEYSDVSHIDIDTAIALIYSGENVWMNCVNEMGMWYMANIHTYQGSGIATRIASSPSYKKVGVRNMYVCDLFEDDVVYVGDDCTAFVSACLVYLAYKTNTQVYTAFKDVAYGSAQFTSDGPASDLLTSLGFEHYDIDGSNMEQLDYDGENVVPGDIVVVYEGNGGQHHGEIFWGERDSIEKDGVTITSWLHGTNYAAMSWGNTHDNMDGHYGMPSMTVGYRYTECWHYTKGTNAQLGGGSIGRISTTDDGKHSTIVGNLTTLQFAPGPHPFAHIPPYKGYKAYDMRRSTIKPALTFQDLLKPADSGEPRKSPIGTVKPGTDRVNRNTFGGKRNNPCDISSSSSDKGLIGTTPAPDGQQSFGIYDSVLNGLVSAMRLLRRKYAGKSIRGVNNGYQGYVLVTEDPGLSACRISWITHACERMNIGPMEVIDLKDKETLMAFTNVIAGIETSSYFGRETLETAYKIAFG